MPERLQTACLYLLRCVQSVYSLGGSNRNCTHSEYFSQLDLAGSSGWLLGSYDSCGLYRLDRSSSCLRINTQPPGERLNLSMYSMCGFECVVKGENKCSWACGCESTDSWLVLRIKDYMIVAEITNSQWKSASWTHRQAVKHMIQVSGAEFSCSYTWPWISNEAVCSVLYAFIMEVSLASCSCWKAGIPMLFMVCLFFQSFRKHHWYECWWLPKIIDHC